MEHLLKKLETHFQKNKIYSFANKGLLKNQIVDFFHSKLGNTIPIDPVILQLYEWRNGYDESILLGGDMYAQDCWLWGNKAFLSLEFGWENSEFYKHEKIYSPGVFTPFDSLLADSLFIDMYAYSEFGYTPVNIYVISPEFVKYDFKLQIYDSIEIMLMTILKSFEEGAFFYDTNGELDADFYKSYEISKKLNPNSEYWFVED